MLTPDTAIDRRILQEAATLTESWAEVLVVAMQPSDSPYPQFELAGETKVRRFRFDGTDPRVLPWVPVRDGIARRVHALVSRLQRALDGAAPDLGRCPPPRMRGGAGGWPGPGPESSGSGATPARPSPRSWATRAWRAGEAGARSCYRPG